MKLKRIKILNYRKFDDVTLELNSSLDSNVTILAGANNSGKTSIMELLRHIFTRENNTNVKLDVPSRNITSWLDTVYFEFEKYCISKDITSLINSVYGISNEGENNNVSFEMKTTQVNFEIIYEEDEDISLFSDYIMDLDDNKKSFYFIYKYQLDKKLFVDNINFYFDRLCSEFTIINDLEKDKSQNEKKLEVKKKYIKDLLVDLYFKSLKETAFYTDADYGNEKEINEIARFRNLFQLFVIEANRPLDDNSKDHNNSLTKQMINLSKESNEWQNLMKALPDKLLEPIIESDVQNEMESVSSRFMHNVISQIDLTNGGNTGNIYLNLNVTEEDTNKFIGDITKAMYKIEDYYLDESSQGLGYSNLIYMILKLEEYQKKADVQKVNLLFIEEPESHMHPQMQYVFMSYLLDKYEKESNNQMLITTHSNNMVRVAKCSNIRVIRPKSQQESFIVNLRELIEEEKDGNKSEKENENRFFFDFMFQMGFSDIIFADKAIFYEGDTERLYINKLLLLEEYKKLRNKYISYIQVGGAYAHKYAKLINLLKIKSLIITDIDYAKELNCIRKIRNSKTTNGTIKYFYRKRMKTNDFTVNDLYNLPDKQIKLTNIVVAFQTDDDGYTRTLEEAMICRLYGIRVDTTKKREEWETKRKSNGLNYSIPQNVKIGIRKIIKATSGAKTDFMYSVIYNKDKDMAKKMQPDYIRRGLEWLMQ